MKGLKQGWEQEQRGKKKLIGQGTFGKVYKMEENGSVYCIKEIDKTLQKKYGRQKYMNREICTLMKNNNEHLVKFLDYEEKDMKHIIKMQYCQGENLKQFLLSQTYGELMHNNRTQRVGVQLSLDIIEALVQLRKSMIGHRDIKAENIIIKKVHANTNAQKQYHATLVDFGESKFLLGEARSVVGTFGYMAPEIYFQQPYTEKCDCYSLGYTLFLIFEGRKHQFKGLVCPFQESFMQITAEERVKLYNSFIYQQIIFSKKRTPKVFRQAIVQFLHPNPEKRLTILSFLELLQNNIEDLGLCCRGSEQIRQRIKKLVSTQKESDKKRQYIEERKSKIKYLYLNMMKEMLQKISLCPKNQRAKVYFYINNISEVVCKYIEQGSKAVGVSPQYFFQQIIFANDGLKELYKNFKDNVNMIFNFLVMNKVSYQQDKTITEQVRNFIKEVFVQQNRINQVLSVSVKIYHQKY